MNGPYLSIKMSNFYDLIRYQIGPPLLVFICPIATQVLTYLGGPLTGPWHYSIVGNAYSWIVVTLMFLYAFCSLWIPGSIYEGPTTRDGYTPQYKANGFQFFITSVTLFVIMVVIWPSIAVDITLNFQEILATCNITAFVLCLYLLYLGKNNAKKHDSREKEQLPVIYEFYRGMEVHPRLLGVDVKQLTNCRFGLMAWQLLVIAFFAAGWKLHGFSLPHLVSTFLQTVYLGKFYWWETGYFTTLDITLDRAGYYICWGCIVWVPAFYTYASYFIVANRPIISDTTALLIFILGMVSIALNYRVDWEKEYFRDYKNKDECKLWGKKVTYITAKYNTSSGVKESTLLTSGFWGVARHLNYVFEIGLALSWCLPGYGISVLPFCYFVFITVLLVHRVYRDEEKCKAKYGDAWDIYCQAVPYRLLPYVF